MARSSADDMDLKRQCQEVINRADARGHHVILCVKALVNRVLAVGGKSTTLGNISNAKARVLVISKKTEGPKLKAFLQALKYSHGDGILKPAEIFKLKHISKLKMVSSNDKGCTFQLGFDNLKNITITPLHWTVRDKTEMDRIFTCISDLRKEILGTIPEVQNLDIGEMALWDKPSTTTTSSQPMPYHDGTFKESSSAGEENNVDLDEEKNVEELFASYLTRIQDISTFDETLKLERIKLEHENIGNILDLEPTMDQVLEDLDWANIKLDDIGEWLGVFDVKFRSMKDDFEPIEHKINQQETLWKNKLALIEELDKLLEVLRIPSEYKEILTVGTFQEDEMLKKYEACEWLIRAINNLKMPNLEPCYMNMRAVKEKRGELSFMKSSFVHDASRFVEKYFLSVIESTKDKNDSCQKGDPRMPDHSDLRHRCTQYSRLLQLIESLDETSMMQLRTSYCESLNELLRKEVQDFGNQVTNCGLSFSEKYSNMLITFIPHLVDESSFFTTLMCFGEASRKFDMINPCLQKLFEGIKDELILTIDCAFRVENFGCINMHGITCRYVADPRVDCTFVRNMLEELKARFLTKFAQIVDDECQRIKKDENNFRQRSQRVLPYISRFGELTKTIERHMHEESTALIDQIYTRILSCLFETIDNISIMEPRCSDMILLENYATIQRSFDELANQLPSIATFSQRASESYELASSRHIDVVINMNFEDLFQFARRVESLLLYYHPEDVPYQFATSTTDLRKVLHYTMSKIDDKLLSLYKMLETNLTSKDLLPSLWDKCKIKFLGRYGSTHEMVIRIYPSESKTVIRTDEMSNRLANLEIVFFN